MVIIILLLLTASAATSNLIDYINEDGSVGTLDGNLTPDLNSGFSYADELDDLDTFDDMDHFPDEVFQDGPRDEPQFRATTSEIKGTEAKHNVLFVQQGTVKNKTKWMAFCGGSIISTNKILTAADCFYTKFKKLKRELFEVNVIAGLTETPIEKTYYYNTGLVSAIGSLISDVSILNGQWFNITSVHTHTHFRHPSHNLAIVVLQTPITFGNSSYGIVEVATANRKYNGICNVPIARPVACFAYIKKVYKVEARMMSELECNSALFLNTHEFYCTKMEQTRHYLYALPGAGVHCTGTGDPAEKTLEEGVLVGVTAACYVDVAILHTRVALFKDWIQYINTTY